MTTNIWQNCQGSEHIRPLQCRPWRVVEAQHVNSTRHLVDTIGEHDLLEAMVERVKPPVAAKTLQQYHYLLYTPFRYPPLPYGSRFGRQFEPSLWYGSLTVETAFAETAYYRLLFLSGSEADLGVIKCWYNGFQAAVKTEYGVDLTSQPFDKFRSAISSPAHYDASQQLGTEMRSAGLQAIQYYSARDPQGGVNVGLFNIRAFEKKQPISQSWQTWQCTATRDFVEFSRITSSGRSVVHFDAQALQAGAI